MAVDMEAWFREYGWHIVQLEPSIWMGTFATAQEEDFDLFIRQDDEWINMAVSPLAPRAIGGIGPRLALALLRLNERTQMVRVAIDSEGDLALFADLPVEKLSYETFAMAMDMLTATTDALAHALARLVADDSVSPPELNGLLT